MPNTARLQKSENLGPTATQSMNYITKTDFESILVQKLDSLKADLATKECIQGLKDVIEAQKIEINKLESRVVIMERYVAQLQRSADEGLRLCMRLQRSHEKQRLILEGGIHRTLAMNGVFTRPVTAASILLNPHKRACNIPLQKVKFNSR